MNYLNQLGANVRNHMSMIEDNFVEQARRDFPAQPKKSRIGGLTAVNSANRASSPSAKSPGTATKPGAAVTTVTDPGRVRTNQPPVKPTGTVKPYTTTTKVYSERPARPVSGDGTAPARETKPRPAEKVNRPVKPSQSRPASTATSGPNANGQHQKANVPKPSGQRTNNVGEHREPARHNHQPGEAPRYKAPFGKSQPAPQRSSQPAPQRTSQPNKAGQERKSGNDRSPRPQQPQAGVRSKSQSNQTRPQPQGGNWKGSNNRANVNRSNRSQPSWANGRGPKRSGPASRRSALPKPTGPATNVKSVQIPAHMTVKAFAQLMELAAADIIKKLMSLGVMATINQEIDLDTMTLIAAEFGVTATAALTEEEKVQVEEIEDDPASLVKRPPVVTILGHVDHGKTSLLDAIRETHVTAQEAGGITQHIGAYQVELKERKITFLDTPGHAAFTAMRARGAQVTDIAVLVVAADDGVMPQTVEAVNHAKDANVSIIVAINKIDKPGANPDRVKQDLTEYGLVAEEWGGDTVFVPVSAKQRLGIENLLEMILLVADMKELKANPNRSAKGTIIEAELDKGRGPVATVLVQTGTLELGNSIIAGAAFGKVRALINDKGKRVKKAGPSFPVEVIGFDELPEAGDILYAITDERLARQLADKRMQLKRENELQQTQKVTLTDLFSKIKEGAIKELKLIIKADVQGSIEAIRQSLERLSNDEVKVKVIHGGVGAINEGDVTFAAAANAIVIGFNVRPDSGAKRMAEKENVDLQLYRVIYNIIEDVQKAMDGMLDPEYKEVVVSRAEVRAVYKVPKVGNVAGCYIVEGKINRNHEIRLLRDNIVIHEGKIDSLKRFKDDVREVAEGFECGMGIANFNDIKEGDVIEAFVLEEIKRK
jgi:translation initiation factor IF-2